MGFLSSDRNVNETNLHTYNEQVALQGNANVGRISNAGGGNVSIAIEDGSKEAIYANRDVATFAINASHQSVMKTLDALQSNQARAYESVDAAVSAAQHTALNATPVQPGAYAEASEVLNAGNKKYLYAAVAVLVIVAAVAIYKKS